MGRMAFVVAVVSSLILLGGVTAGLVLARESTPHSPPLDDKVTQTSASDRAALVAFYNATDGPNWSDNTNWLSNAALGEWHGVSTDANGRVVVLYLYSNGLSGEIPAELGRLSNLRTLYLSHNRLSGEIPSELGGMTNLQALNLAVNQLSEGIPSGLGDLTNLQALRLNRNRLSGEIPSELGRLTNLVTMYLQGNRLSGEIPSELGRLTNLVELRLNGNGLSGEIPAGLGSPANLQTLCLSANRLEGCVPRNLGYVSVNDFHKTRLPFCSVPVTPTITTLIVGGADSLIVGWIAPARGQAVSAYDLRYVRTDADEMVDANWTVVEDVWTGTGALKYVIAALVAGTQYDVQVRAVSANGEGPWSAIVSGTPLASVGDGDSLGNKVTGVKVEAIPDSPNTIAKWTVQFVNGDISQYSYDGTGNRDQDDNILNGGRGRDVIMVEFEDDVQFPEAVSPNDVVITTNMVWDGQAVDRTVVANPLGVDIVKVAEFAGYAQRVDRPPDETLVTLEIPDMEPAADRPGTQGIAPGATVTVTFRQTAGIKTPTESKADEVDQAERAAADFNGNFDASLLGPLSGYKVQVATSNNGYFVPAGPGNRAVIPRRLMLSDMGGPRGSTVTVVGLGFRNSITAAIWNDQNQNGMRDSGEIDLGFALVTGSDDFTTTITINNPPFDYDLDTNGINAVDGRNRTIIPGRRYMGAISGITSTESIPKYLLESSIKVTPGAAAIGHRVQVTARDFVAGGKLAYARIGIGDVPVTDYEPTVVSSTGDATFELTIPNGIAPGTRELVIKDGPDALNDPGHNIINGGGARTSIVIIGGVIPGALDMPIIKTPIVAGDRSLTVTWRAPIETRGLTHIGYDLRYIRTDADETVEVNWTLVGTIWKIGFYPLEYVLTGLTAGTQYDVQLRAVNAGGNGPWSATATGTPSTWGAVRYLSETYAEPSGEVRVVIIATGYGLYGHVVETLPPGFSYTGSSLNEDAVIVSGREVIFFLVGQFDFTYTVTASSPAGGYYFSGSLVNENRLQQTVGGAASIRVGVGPLVNAFSFSRALVRIDRPIEVLVTFIEPVFGFALDDISVSNGIADNFAGSDGSAFYEFDVMPNAAGAVTVDIAAGAGMDAEGNGNIAAPQLSLGIPYDDDHDGSINKSEAITAVIDYFAGNITKEETIAIIILYFSS